MHAAGSKQGGEGAAAARGDLLGGGVAGGGDEAREGQRVDRHKGAGQVGHQVQDHRSRGEGDGGGGQAGGQAGQRGKQARQLRLQQGGGKGARQWMRRRCGEKRGCTVAASNRLSGPPERQRTADKGGLWGTHGGCVLEQCLDGDLEGGVQQLQVGGAREGAAVQGGVVVARQHAAVLQQTVTQAGHQGGCTQGRPRGGKGGREAPKVLGDHVWLP